MKLLSAVSCLPVRPPDGLNASQIRPTQLQDFKSKNSASKKVLEMGLICVSEAFMNSLCWLRRGFNVCFAGLPFLSSAASLQARGGGVLVVSGRTKVAAENCVCVGFEHHTHLPTWATLLAADASPIKISWSGDRWWSSAPTSQIQDGWKNFLVAWRNPQKTRNVFKSLIP